MWVFQLPRRNFVAKSVELCLIYGGAKSATNKNFTDWDGTN